MGPAFGTIARLVAQNKHTRILAITDNAIPHEKRLGDVPFTKYFLIGLPRFYYHVAGRCCRIWKNCNPLNLKFTIRIRFTIILANLETKADAISSLTIRPCLPVYFVFWFYPGL